MLAKISGARHVGREGVSAEMKERQEPFASSVCAAGSLSRKGMACGTTGPAQGFVGVAGMKDALQPRP